MARYFMYTSMVSERLCREVSVVQRPWLYLKVRNFRDFLKFGLNFDPREVFL